MPIVGESAAHPVEYPAAPGRDQAEADPVLIGQGEITRRLCDLQLIKAAGEDSENRDLARPENQCSAGKLPLTLQVAAHRLDWPEQRDLAA